MVLVTFAATKVTRPLGETLKYSSQEILYFYYSNTTKAYNSLLFPPTFFVCTKKATKKTNSRFA
jgi:hypothetical protein